MKKIVRKKTTRNENIHLKCENEAILVKVIYNPTSTLGEFLYSLLITYKNSNTEVKHDIGCFNITKAKYALGNIVIDKNLVKVIPKKMPTKVYNLHESDIKEYVFKI